MAAQRERRLTILVSAQKDGSPPVPIARLDDAVDRWAAKRNYPGGRFAKGYELRAGDGVHEPRWELECHGPYAIGEVRGLARMLVEAMRHHGGHARIFLYELLTHDERFIRELEIASEDIEEFHDE